MKRWVMVLVAWWVVATSQAEPLRVRLGGQGRAVMRVLGVDEAGLIRLRPETGDDGEALLPLGEARDFQFVLPEDYRRAQQLAFAGRGGEAVMMLRRIVPALVPYVGVEGSNARGQCATT
ncbi:MAG: hypothetical protein J6386_10645 [Candidatus Synoicihabitans palmerolidicus]|nr:hypothetical protein [Candidatus Synoicihabitans palmerolidicus]